MKAWRYIMDKFKNKNEKIIFNMIYPSMVFTMVYLFGLGMGLELNIFLQLVMVFILSSIVKYFLLNPLILYILLAIGFLSAILIHSFITPILFTIVEKLFYLFENIINNLQGKENIASDNMILFWAILLVILSLLTSFVLFKKKSIYLLLPLYICPFLYYWYNFFDESYWMISIFLVLFFILMGLDKYSKKDVDKLFTPWLQTVTRYSIIILLTALILPKNYNYINWPWLQQKVYSTFPSIENLRSYDSYSRKTGAADLFSFSMTGYQNNSTRLGGPVSLSNTKIMTVRGYSSNYLRGNVKHIYTGNTWETVVEPSTHYGLRKDFSGISPQDKKNFYSEKSITITNHSFASTTLFSPYKVGEVSFNSNHFLQVNRDDALVFPNGVYDMESYMVKIYEPLPYGKLLTLGIDHKKKDLADLNIYLQIPRDRITQRTKSLVKEIVKDAKGDFEKAMAIENHLRNNYPYNLGVDEVPENRDFIDYFLFDGKEGYCTYYATSMAIMLRLEGIPSRYIEGYLAKDSEVSGVYEVKHENAHAWVEAFIEPVGWMTFEPTPVYPIQSRLEDYQLSILDEGLNPNEANENSMDQVNDLDGIMIDMDQNIPGGRRNENQEEFFEDIPRDISKYVLIIFIGILLFIIPFRFLIGFFKYRNEEIQAKKLSNENRVIYLYKQVVKLIGFLGFPQQNGETHYEYAERIAYKFYSYSENGIKEITHIFVKSKYSNESTSDEDVLELEKYKSILEKRLKNYWGFKTYYYRKYVLRLF